ncbi:MAG: hypothetical protein AB1589_34100 [Cyanobacteriota bacterium]
MELLLQTPPVPSRVPQVANANTRSKLHLTSLTQKASRSRSLTHRKCHRLRVRWSFIDNQ